MKKRKHLPYTHDVILNAAVSDILDDWNRLVEKARGYGLDICLAPGTETLELYFHDDYPDMILVDKEESSRMKGD